MGIKARSAAPREKRIAQHVEAFVRTYATRDETSGDSWFELGCMLANVYEEQRRAGEEAVLRIGHKYDEFTPTYCWKQAVAKMPDHPRAWLRLGLHYYDEGYQEDDAERCLRLAVKYDPGSTVALMHLGMAVLPAGEPDLDRVAEAEAHFTKALELNKSEAADWGVFDLLAQAAHLRREPQLALTWYERGAVHGDMFCEKMRNKMARQLCP